MPPGGSSSRPPAALTPAAGSLTAAAPPPTLLRTASGPRPPAAAPPHRRSSRSRAEAHRGSDGSSRRDRYDRSFRREDNIILVRLYGRRGLHRRQLISRQPQVSKLTAVEAGRQRRDGPQLSASFSATPCDWEREAGASEGVHRPCAPARPQDAEPELEAVAVLFFWQGSGGARTTIWRSESERAQGRARAWARRVRRRTRFQLSRRARLYVFFRVLEGAVYSLRWRMVSRCKVKAHRNEEIAPAP